MATQSQDLYQTMSLSEQKKVLAHLASLSSEPLIQAFAQQYLQSVPLRTLQQYTPTALATFLKDRYSFFSNTVANRFSKESFHLSFLQTPSKHTLEIVCPDAPFIIITIEALFRELEIPITRLFHPIISVEIEKSRLLSIKKAAVNSFLVSVIYIEFDAHMTPDIKKTLASRIALHLDAIQHAFKDQAPICDQIALVHTLIAKSTLSLQEPKEEWANLLNWLQSSNFSFYGFVTLTSGKIDKNGLGILSSSFLSKTDLPLSSVLQSHTKKYEESNPFQFDTIPVKSPVQRFENLMRLSFTFDTNRGLVEYVFLGLLKRSSLFVKNIETPLIHLKMRYIFKKKNMIPGSYNYTEVIRIFTSIPKFELFRTSAEDLLEMVEHLLSITNPNDVCCFAQIKKESCYIRLLVVIPHTLFSRTNIALVKEYLRTTLPHQEFEIIEIRGEEKCRLHIHLYTTSSKDTTLNCSAIESDIRSLVKPWEDALKDALLEAMPERASELLAKYIRAFPSHYRVIRTASQAIEDITCLDHMCTTYSRIVTLKPFYFPNSALSGKASMLSIYSKTKLDLITIMPVLQNIGLHVYDELTISVGPQQDCDGYIHCFRVANADKTLLDDTSLSAPLAHLLEGVFANTVENDILNGLLLTAHLDWRSISVLQTYRNYHFQIKPTFSRDKINNTLLANPHCTALIFRYFDTKFSPTSSLSTSKRASLLHHLEKDFFECLSTVEDVSEDTILRSLFQIVEATLRTNFYIPKQNKDTFISIKIDPHAIKGLPLPIPYREIYVHDIGVEGIHLRFGPVARGGLRWSDRHDDFRTEVLSLVKTQQVKNVVIVPEGSKGGFVIKQKPTSKEAYSAEGIQQYQRFIRALLDITDNVLSSGEVVHPEHLVVYDGKDPYLVVAADKGTANFSDIANEISDSFGFWLGDAFASGGSVGYNHKKEAITARGAWECTVLHFKEQGKDSLKESITVAGIGDMSGDVFGNGLLLSKKVRLLAAFNHVHIFLDPCPDEAKSWKERKRLFDLPRSSWTDYNPALISKGGGIFERKAKEIHLSEAIKHMLGITEAVITGEALVRKILTMHVDLLWFGGIGTYIKASDQSHLQVGDPSNDSVRVDATHIRASVIGEGANLGVTQLARIELNQRGIRLNTDAIDNSAGVNMSDYEVNIKILLKRMLEEGILKTVKERNSLLEKATSQVSELVLTNNRSQHQLISMDALRYKRYPQPLLMLIDHYVSSGFLDAKTENVPSIRELEHLSESKNPFPRSVIAVIQAYVKMDIYQHLVKDPILDHPHWHPIYCRYFPTVFLDRFGTKVLEHHLKKEILATWLTNRIVNQAGTVCLFNIQQSTQRSVGDIISMYWLINDGIQADSLRLAIHNQPISQEAIYQALIALEDAIEILCVNILQQPFPLQLEDTKEVGILFEAFVNIHKKEKKPTKKNRWAYLGFGDDLSKKLAFVEQLGSLSDSISLTKNQNIAPIQAIHLVDLANRFFHLDWIQKSLQSLILSDLSEIELRHGALHTLHHRKLTILSQVSHHKQFSKLLSTSSESTQYKMFSDIASSLFAEPITPYFDHIHQIRHRNDTLSLVQLLVVLNRFPTPKE